MVYETGLGEQREIVLLTITIELLQQFLLGEREFDDAATVEEYVVPVDVYSDTTVVEMDGNAVDPGRR